MKAFLIKQLAIILTSKQAWNQITDLITIILDDDSSGSEKRAMVLTEMEESGTMLKSYLSNLLLELAYTYLHLTGIVPDKVLNKAAEYVNYPSAKD